MDMTSFNRLIEQIESLLTHLLTYLQSYPLYHKVVLFISTPGWPQLLCCFTACSLLMIRSLNKVEKNGFEGTLTGTLIMPYFSGFPNICFAWLMSQKHGSGTVVLENCLVNNLTTLTLVLAIPAFIWGLNLFKSNHMPLSELRINRLSILLSLLALVFFTAALFIVSKDGEINQTDGIVLAGLFLFWQVIHIFDVLKNNTRKQVRIKKRIWFDLAIISLCAWGIFSSIDHLIDLVSSRTFGLFSRSNLGLLSGMLMVVPNALLAVYYAGIDRSDIAYSSQIGDCHICIPLCIGLYAFFSPIAVYPNFLMSLYILFGAAAIHLLFITASGKLSRLAGILLAGLYGFLLYKGVS